MEQPVVLCMEDISKEFSGNRVLKNVSLTIRKGEIHALMGENGAGKSTLMNILFGMPVIASTGGFEGRVTLDGAPVTIASPQQAMEAGIGMVHQEFMLIPGFTIAENIKVGREISTPNLFSRVLGRQLETLDLDTMRRDARKALDTVGLNVDEYVRVAGLPVGYMQFIEIAREIDKTGVRLLVFDEPTAVLTESEADQLLEAMRAIAASGIAIVFITHRLSEVMAVTDRVTILRDGELVATRDTAETSVTEIAQLMVGRPIEGQLGTADESRDHFDTVALRVRDLTVNMPGEEVEGVDLDVFQGEIFGIGGLAGQGKLGIPNGIMGLHAATGMVEAFGKQLKLDRLGEALGHGISFVSEDRRGVGLLLDDSIRLNIVFTAMVRSGKFLRMGLLNAGEANRHADDMIRRLDIRCTGREQHVGSLSGGNQQKVCIARALTTQPRILIVSEPTRGIDIGAKRLVLDLLRQLNREQGLTVIMVSSELLELRSICDRIALVADGRISAILRPTDSDVEFGLAMSGDLVRNTTGAEGGAAHV